MEKWSRKYNKCKKCGTTSIIHIQHGYCDSCWNKKIYKKNKKYYQEYYKKYWKKNKKQLTAKRKATKKLCVNQQSSTLSNSILK